jgi:hypothetical protein
VLLPSDTHTKPITSITAVLLPLVTYILTLSGNKSDFDIYIRLSFCIEPNNLLVYKNAFSKNSSGLH